MSTLDKVRLALRISHMEFDELELLPLIEAARSRMIISGVSKNVAYDEHNSLVNSAIVFFAKANFGMGTTGPQLSSFRNIERNEQAFFSVVEHLALAGDC